MMRKKKKQLWIAAVNLMKAITQIRITTKVEQKTKK
eukprot:UN18447